MTRERVLVAMSGGVDSAVAAARLVEEGLDVVGVTLHLWDYPDDGTVRGRCCAPEDQRDARRVADHLGIPHYSFDRRELFRARVVEPFLESYLDGQTPSPCVSCNRSVKMRELFDLCARLGASRIATGHYARVVVANGQPRLHRGRDAGKDQSYFLHMLSAADLARLVLPLGELTKEEVRADAIARGLPGAMKGESQELCFVPTGRYDAFVEKHVAADRMRPGPIVDSDGRTVGHHGGVHGFTLGQRKGLGVALGKPAFVFALDAETATVHVGDEAHLFTSEASITDASWSDDVVFPLEADVRVRSRHDGARAVIDRGASGAFTVRFAEPVRAVSPGQVAVAYAGDRVLGGGTLVRPVAAREAVQ